MKKVYSIFLLGCVVLLSLVSCQKDTVTLRARISTFSSPDKIYMEPVTDGCMPRWQNNDPVWINGNNGYTVSVSGQNASIGSVLRSGDYRAIYPAGIVRGDNNINSTSIAIELPRVQSYIFRDGHQVVEAPMGAWSDDNMLDFSNMGALLAVKILNNTDAGLTRSSSVTIDSISVTSITENTPLWGEGLVQDINTASRRYVMTPADASNIEKYYTVSLGGITNANMPRSTADADAKVFYLYIPASTGATQNRFEVNVYAHNPASGTFVYTRTQTIEGQGNIGLNRVACVPMDLCSCSESFVANAIPQGAVDAMFTVAPGVQVYFSQANLMYNTRANVFKFGENQFDVLGDVYNPDTNVKPELIDLFGWGTSGYYSSSDPYAMYCYPYSVNYDGTGSTYNQYGYGPSTNNAVGKQLSTNYNYDWGSRIGGDVHWRTLTEAEWKYLLKSRGSAVFGGGNDMSFRICKVKLSADHDPNRSMVDGVVIFPDNFRGQAGLIHEDRDHIGAAASARPGYDDNGNPIYDEDEIIANNIIFLPAAGSREGQTVNGIQAATKYKVGFNYWTAISGLSATSPNRQTARALNASLAFVSMNRYFGYAVRLVVDCE